MCKEGKGYSTMGMEGPKVGRGGVQDEGRGRVRVFFSQYAIRSTSIACLFLKWMKSDFGTSCHTCTYGRGKNQLWNSKVHFMHYKCIGGSYGANNKLVYKVLCFKKKDSVNKNGWIIAIYWQTRELCTFWIFFTSRILIYQGSKTKAWIWNFSFWILSTDVGDLTMYQVGTMFKITENNRMRLILASIQCFHTFYWHKIW